MSREKRAEAEGVSTQGSQALARRTWQVGAGARKREQSLSVFVVV